MKARLIDKQDIAEGTMEFTFQIEDSFSFVPGQYIVIKIPLIYPDNRGSERPFSIVNSSAEKGIIRIATRMTGFLPNLVLFGIFPKPIVIKDYI